MSTSLHCVPCIFQQNIKCENLVCIIFHEIPTIKKCYSHNCTKNISFKKIVMQYLKCDTLKNILPFFKENMN